MASETWEQSWAGTRGARETKRGDILKETSKERNHNAGRKVTLGRKEGNFQHGREERGYLRDGDLGDRKRNGLWD